MEKITSLRNLLIEQLREVCNGENQQLYFLQLVKNKVGDKELKMIIKNHIEVTKLQIKRLKNIFNKLFVSSIGEHSEIMVGLINEANDLIERSYTSLIMDTVIISSIQFIKHFEIAGYGTAYAYAEELGLRDIADDLYLSLEEEKEMDVSLSEIAMDQVNSKAKVPILV